MTKPLLIIGSNGQLASALRALNLHAVFLDRTNADLSSPDKLADILEKYDPSAVINAAAYTHVDNAESEVSLAFAVNAQSPTVMAIYCANRHIPFVHFSTDYVFHGQGSTPWKENDMPSPVNAYGRSKLAGEDAIAHVGGSYLIFRTSWVYDAYGRNFFNTILRLASEREELKIIDDQFGAPTYAHDLAIGSLSALQAAMLKKHFPSGIYHLCGQGVTTWHGFASSIIDLAKQAGLPIKTRLITKITTSEYPLPAARPHNSRLDCSKVQSMLGVSLTHWEEGLRTCMEKKCES